MCIRDRDVRRSFRSARHSISLTIQYPVGLEVHSHTGLPVWMVSRPQPLSWASDDTRGPVGLECVFHSRYHGFITDRDGVTLELEADHRRPAEIENAIRDLKYGWAS